MFTRILGIVIILSFRGMFKKISGNVQKYLGERSKGFRGILLMIPGNAQESSVEL